MDRVIGILVVAALVVGSTGGDVVAEPGLVRPGVAPFQDGVTSVDLMITWNV